MGLTIQDGKLVVRDGALGTESACCCRPGCCCINGEPDATKTTQAACEAAFGVWTPGADCETHVCTGCCCINGEPDATKTTQAACEEAFGVWTPGADCETHVCTGCCCGGNPAVPADPVTPEDCAAISGTWLGYGRCETIPGVNTTHCVCTECAPADENFVCPDGYFGPDFGNECWSSGFPCWKPAGIYQDCTNCQPSQEGNVVAYTSIPCNLWAAYEPYADANPLP